jgi:NADH dehydrogenase [ubiquinone] 1 alpha subcomplex assembly factor 5
MPTIYADRVELLFDDAFQIMEFLQCIGENNALLQSRNDMQRELLLSVAAIYDSLFRSQRHPDKVFASFHIINFLGWKYHESQQKPKQRGTAEFSLKVLQKELEESGDPTEGKITAQSGTIEVDESDAEEEKSHDKKSKENDGEGKK